MPIDVDLEDRIWLALVTKAEAENWSQERVDSEFMKLMAYAEYAEAGDANAQSLLDNGLAQLGVGGGEVSAPRTSPFRMWPEVPVSGIGDVLGTIGRWANLGGSRQTAPIETPIKPPGGGAGDVSVRAPIWTARLAALEAKLPLTGGDTNLRNAVSYLKILLTTGYTDAEITRDFNQKFGIGAEGEKAATTGTLDQDLRTLQWARDNGYITDEEFRARARALTLGAPGAGGMTPYQAAQLGLQERQEARQAQATAIQAARTGDPLTYMAMIRGGVPGTGPTGEIYQGLNRVVPSVGGMIAPGYTEQSVSPNFLPTATGMPSAPGGLPSTGMATDDPLVAIGQAALRAGLGEEGARTAMAIALAEGGMSGGVGDVGGGGSYGPFQLYTQGELANFARELNMTVPEAAQYVQRNPMASVDWALTGYLGNAIRQGMATGLSGPDLASYAQQYGQRSAPETYQRAGQAYSRLAGVQSGVPGYIANTAWNPPPMPEFMRTLQESKPLGMYTIPAGTLRPPGVQAQANLSPYERSAMLEAVEYQGVPGADYEDYLARLRRGVGPGLGMARYGGTLRGY